MIINFTKKFIKQFEKLRKEEQKRVNEALELFKENPFAYKLRNHALSGKYNKIHSISAGGDIRLHYYEKEDEVTIVFIEIGTHSQLYR
jgi:addiction module RelE/StbE family toxin